METKEAYKKKVEAQLKKWSAGIEDLMVKAERVKAETKSAYKREIQELHDKKKELHKKIEELKAASSETWESLKTGIEITAAELKSALDSLVSKKATPKKGNPMTVGIKKEYLKSKNLCRITFRLPKIAAPDAKRVCIVGDFNNWSIHANPMKRLKNGNYTITLHLEPGREYQFRYLIDEVRWENDWNADNYVKSPYGDSDNSVVIV